MNSNWASPHYIISLGGSCHSAFIGKYQTPSKHLSVWEGKEHIEACRLSWRKRLSTGSSLRVLSAVRSLPVEPNKGPLWHRGSTPPGAQSPLTRYRQEYQRCLRHCKLKIPQQSKDFSTFLQRSTWFNSLKQHRQMLSSLRSGFQTISPNCNMRRQLCLLNDAR